MISIFNFKCGIMKNELGVSTGIIEYPLDTTIHPVGNSVLDKIVGAKIGDTVVGIYRRVYWND